MRDPTPRVSVYERPSITGIHTEREIAVCTATTHVQRNLGGWTKVFSALQPCCAALEREKLVWGVK